jgi:hypothetical protein
MLGERATLRQISAPAPVSSIQSGILARPATIPRARATETEQKAISIIPRQQFFGYPSAAFLSIAGVILFESTTFSSRSLPTLLHDLLGTF